MTAGIEHISPSNHAPGNSAPSAETTLNPILAERWPSLSRALNRYQENTAESFTREAYDCVQAGVIRLQDRRTLAARAEVLGIRDFDAQLLIACAVRQWALDRRYDPTPSREAPKLSFEYRSFWKIWWRIGIVLVAAVGIDAVIIWKWMS